MVTENFTKKILDSLIGNIAIFLLNMLFPYVVTRFYGADILGGYTYAYSIILITTFFAALGLNMGMLYFIPREGNKYVTASFVISMCSSTVIMLILYLFNKDIVVRAMLPLVCFLSAEDIFFSIYRVKQNIKEYFFVKVIAGFTLKIILTWVFFSIFGINPTNLILATYISLAVSLVFYFIKQRDMFGKFHITKDVIIYSLPLMVGSMMFIIMNNVDMIMIGNILDKEQVAIYSVGSNIATLPSILLTALNTVFPPIVAKLYHDNEIEKLGQMYKKSARTLTALSSVIILVIVLFRNIILSYYGPEFADGANVIIYRSIGQLVNASVGSVWYIICMTGRAKINMIGKISATIINVVLNFILIPIMGIDGAALASMIAVVFSNILGYTIVKRILNVKVFKIA